LLEVGRARKRLLDYAGQLPKQPQVRIDLAATGAIALRADRVRPSTPIEAVLAGEAVHSGDEFLHHKTTRREVYDRALLAHPETEDVLFCGMSEASPPRPATAT
jgi:hypothetical protein